MINKEKCTKCGICVDICMSDVFYATKKGEYPTITYPEECWHCNACVIDCPEKAVSLRFPLHARVVTE